MTKLERHIAEAQTALLRLQRSWEDAYGPAELGLDDALDSLEAMAEQIRTDTVGDQRPVRWAYEVQPDGSLRRLVCPPEPWDRC